MTFDFYPIGCMYGIFIYLHFVDFDGKCRERLGKVPGSLYWLVIIPLLVGGFNQFEKHSSNWIISPGRDKNLKKLKPPASIYIMSCLVP